MDNEEMPTVSNSKQKNKKKNSRIRQLLNNKKIKRFIITHIPQILIAIGIGILVIFLLGIVMFIITMPGLILGAFDEFGRNLLGNIEGLLNGNSTTAKISNQEIVNLAQHLQRMGYDIQGYGLGNVKYKDDGQTVSSRNGKAKEIEKIEKSVDGKHYLKAYIAANENTYVLSQWSIGGALSSLIDNTQNALGSFIDLSIDDFKATSAEDYSTGMINIVGQSNGIIISQKNSDFVAIDRNTKQMKIYSSGFELPGILGRYKKNIYRG